MSKYFMSGTRYESFERMMMTLPTHSRPDDTPKENKGRNRNMTKKGGAEKNAVPSNTQ